MRTIGQVLPINAHDLISDFQLRTVSRGPWGNKTIFIFVWQVLCYTWWKSNRHINQNNCTQMHSINKLPAGRIIGNLLFSEQNCLSSPHHYYFVHLGKQEMSACTASEFNACIYHWKFPIVGNNVKFINVIPVLDEIDYYKQK